MPHVALQLLASSAIFAATTVHAAPASPPATKPATTAKPVVAATKAPSADASLKAGEKKLNAGDAAGALVDFKAADAAKPTAESAHFVGLADDQLGHFHDAVAAYERFVAAAPASMSGEVEVTNKRIAEIKAMPATVKVSSMPSGATLAIDGTSQPQATPVDVKLAPGTHVLRLTAPDYEAYEREIEVSYASTKVLNLDLVAVPPAPTPPQAVVVAPPPPAVPVAPVAPFDAPESSWLTRQNVGFIAGGIAVVGIGLGTGFGIAALNNKSAFDKNPTLSTGNDGNEFAVASDVAFGAAAVMGVTSLILLLTDSDSSNASAAFPPAVTPTSATRPSAPQRKSAFSAAPLLAPHTAGASAVLHF